MATFFDFLFPIFHTARGYTCSSEQHFPVRACVPKSNKRCNTSELATTVVFFFGRHYPTYATHTHQLGLPSGTGGTSPLPPPYFTKLLA